MNAMSQAQRKQARSRCEASVCSPGVQDLLAALDTLDQRDALLREIMATLFVWEISASKSLRQRIRAALEIRLESETIADHLAQEV